MPTIPSIPGLSELLNQLSEEAGLYFLGFTDLELQEQYQWFKEWLEDGNQASMGYLENHPTLREDPRLLLDGAAAAAVFALPYRSTTVSAEIPQVAQYARGQDYHKTLRQKLTFVWNAFLSHLCLDPAPQFRVLVDSAPVLERALAVKTGAGSIGKNSCFISSEHGSFLLLGSIITQPVTGLEVSASDLAKKYPRAPKQPPSACGSCERCKIHCPTGALNKDFQVDSRRCLAYWTIEHRGAIPLEFWPHLKKYYFGCDICQAVCPQNRQMPFAPPLPHGKDPKPWQMPLGDIALMDQKTYEDVFGGTAMTRAKRSGLRRNALIAMVVTGDQRLKEVLQGLDGEEDPVLQETIGMISRYFEEIK